MKRIFKNRRFWLIFAPTICASVWMLIAMWLMSCSKRHEWISSFIEVAFALNASLTFRWFREKLTEPLQIDLIPRIKKVVRNQTNLQAQELAADFLKENETLVAKLREDSSSCIVFPVRLAQAACVVAVCMLLSDFGLSEHTWVVPALLVPYVIFCVILMVNWVFVLREELILLGKLMKQVEEIVRN